MTSKVRNISQNGKNGVITISITPGGLSRSTARMKYNAKGFQDSLRPRVTILQETQIIVLSHKNNNLVNI